LKAWIIKTSKAAFNPDKKLREKNTVRINKVALKL
jgi:hypothetical protein